MTPRTEIGIRHVDSEGKVHLELYEREGEIQVQEQLTSWARECALAFYRELFDRERG